MSSKLESEIAKLGRAETINVLMSTASVLREIEEQNKDYIEKYDEFKSTLPTDEFINYIYIRLALSMMEDKVARDSVGCPDE